MGKSKTARPKQDRKYEVDLYPDAENYDFAEVLSKLQDYFDMWAWNVHDKDVDPETGELKKRHVHFVGRRENPVPLQSVANAVGVPAQYIQFVKSLKGAFRYLVHADSPEKYQYDHTNVVANFDYIQVCGLLKDVDYAKRIMRYIVDNRVISTKQLADWCLQNDCWAEFRRGYRIWYDIMWEIRGLPIEKLPASFSNDDNSNSQVEIGGMVEHPDGFDPKPKKK